MQAETLAVDPNFNYLGTFDSLGDAFVQAVHRALACGRENEGRGHSNRELPRLAFVLSNPRARLIDIEGRRTNIPFLMAEFLWHITCRTDAAMLAAYAPNIIRFTADGSDFTGSAYGPRLFRGGAAGGASQWDSVLECLREDAQTRRAVLALMQAGEDRSRANRDVTCTVALQLLVREGRLDLVTQMRSNDIMRGLASDVFLFTLLQELAAAELGLALGTYTHITNVAQIYARDLRWARDCVEQPVRSKGDMSPLPCVGVWRELEAISAVEETLRRGVAPAARRLSPGSPFDAWRCMFQLFHTQRGSADARDIDWIAEYRRVACGSPTL